MSVLFDGPGIADGQTETNNNNEAMKNSQNLIEEYQAIMAQDGIQGTIEKVHVEIPPLAGEHLGSDCVCVTLHMDDGTLRELFVKKVSSHPPGFFEDAEMFEKESSFVNVLLKDFQRKHREHAKLNAPLDFFPKYLYADDKMIVMDKLGSPHGKDKGYFQVSKMVKLNLDYTKCVLRNLALFHAMSFNAGSSPGIRDEFLGRYPFLREKFYTAGKEAFDITYDNLLRAKIAMLKAANLPNADKAIQALEQGLGTVYGQVRNAVRHESDHMTYLVNHGDCWIANLMFKADHPETKKPTHQVFLDFQFIRLGSPNLDLSYFLFSSAQPPVLRNNWNAFLEYYFQELKANVERMDKPFPHTFPEFLHDFKSKLGFGFWLNMTLFQGFDLFPHIDMKKVEEDIEDTGLGQQVSEWIQKHPARASELATEIISLVETFNQICKD